MRFRGGLSANRPGFCRVQRLYNSYIFRTNFPESGEFRRFARLRVQCVLIIKTSYVRRVTRLLPGTENELAGGDGEEGVRIEFSHKSCVRLSAVWCDISCMRVPISI